MIYVRLKIFGYGYVGFNVEDRAGLYCLISRMSVIGTSSQHIEVSVSPNGGTYIFDGEEIKDVMTGEVRESGSDFGSVLKDMVVHKTYIRPCSFIPQTGKNFLRYGPEGAEINIACVSNMDTIRLSNTAIPNSQQEVRVGIYSGRNPVSMVLNFAIFWSYALYLKVTGKLRAVELC